jgi:lysophospholipase L1-like esterase
MKLRIVGLGDSTTAGTPGFLSPLEAPPNGRGNPESQYTYWMMKAHPDWTVLNRGINGQRSDEILGWLESDVLQEKPNYVIILAGVNDVCQGMPLQSIKTNLLAMYQKAIAAQITPVAATVLPYNTASTGESKAIRDLNGWIEETASRLGALFCDTNWAARDSHDPDRLLSSPDGLHPDVSGYRKMGEALAETIDRSINQERKDFDA